MKTAMWAKYGLAVPLFGYFWQNNASGSLNCHMNTGKVVDKIFEALTPPINI
jgi:hypothetical protein